MLPAFSSIGMAASTAALFPADMAANAAAFSSTDMATSAAAAFPLTWFYSFSYALLSRHPTLLPHLLEALSATLVQSTSLLVMTACPSVVLQVVSLSDLTSISGGPQQNETHFQSDINFLERHSGIDLDRDGDIGEAGSPHRTPAEDIGFVRGVANVEVDYDFQDTSKKLRRTANGTETKVNMLRHSHERRKVVRHAIDTAGAGESPYAMWGVLSNFPLHCVHRISTVYTTAMCAATGLHQTRTEVLTAAPCSSIINN